MLRAGWSCTDGELGGACCLRSVSGKLVYHSTLSIFDQPLRAGKTSSPGPAAKNILCWSFFSLAEVRYQDRQTRCVLTSSIAGSSEKMASRSSGMLKASCAFVDTPGFFCWTPRSLVSRNSERASTGVLAWATDDVTTLKWQDGLWFCQCARWQAVEQYETALQRPHCLSLCVLAHEAQVVRSLMLICSRRTYNVE